MCGRVNCSLAHLALLRMLGLQMFLNSDLFTPKYNLGPQSHLPSIRNKKENEPTCQTIVNPDSHNQHQIIQTMKWGINSPNGQLVINARIEDIYHRSMFKEISKEQRCVIPINGYYEWQTTVQSVHPFYIYHKSDRVIMIGGLYRQEGSINKLVIVTSEATGMLRDIHNRRPLVLDDEGMK